MNKVRSDALPDAELDFEFRDEGCDFHPKCLECPLPKCRYDVQGGLRALTNIVRDKEIKELKMRGLSSLEIARRLGISRRTVFRSLVA